MANNNIDDIFSDSAFDGLNDEQKEAFKKLYVRLQGKTMEEAMMVLMEFNRSMPKGKPISNAERNAMLSVVLESLDEKDRVQMKKVLKMLGI